MLGQSYEYANVSGKVTACLYTLKKKDHERNMKGRQSEEQISAFYVVKEKEKFNNKNTKNQSYKWGIELVWN